MADSTVEQNLLLGVMALHLGFISEDAFLDAIRAWTLDHKRALAPLLCELQALQSEEANMLTALAASLVRRNGNDPLRPLGDMLPQELVPALVDLNDPQLRHCLGNLGKGPSAATVNYAGPLGETPTIQSTPDQSRQSSPATPSDARARYRIVRHHARGGLGEVFVAHDEELQREVALKEMQAQHLAKAENRTRFLLEGEITGRLEHPGIVPVYGLGLYPDGRPYYAMRFIRGECLSIAIHRFHRTDSTVPGERALELRKLLSRFIEVCNAIEYAHSKGVLHRDIKPDNIMLGPYGETLVVDWGLAKELGNTQSPDCNVDDPNTPRPSRSEETGSLMGQVMGTPQFMSPEQAAGRIDLLGPASDVYSLGATLYHLLTGQAPFTSDPDVYKVLRMVQSGSFLPPRQLNPTSSKPLEAICLKAMAASPGERYSSAKELAGDVERFLADEPVGAWREPWTIRTRRWARRNRTTVVAAAVLCVTALILVSVSYFLLEAATHDRALAQVDALLDANPQAVPALLEGLDTFQQQVSSRLREVRHGSGRRHRVRASLALLAQGHTQEVEFLRERLVDPELDPEECLLLRKCLAPHAASLIENLWGEVDKVEATPEQRFRALVALADFDPSNPRWETDAPKVVVPLLQADPLHVGIWTEALSPVREELIGSLSEVFSDPLLPSERRVAATVLRAYVADHCGRIVKLLATANPFQFGLLLPRLQAHGETALVELKDEFNKAKSADDSEEDRDLLARRRANLAAALLHLGESQHAWQLLRHSQFPDARTNLIHLLPALEANPEILLRQLHVEKDDGIRRALVLALGGYSAEQFPAASRTQVQARLMDWYSSHPDPGLHSAIGWLLRGGRENNSAGKLDWELAASLKEADSVLAGKPAGNKRWFVTPHGETMVLLGPDEFDMGSPVSEPGHESDETLHRRRIGRTFAVAAHEVTVRQFKRFLDAIPNTGHKLDRKYSPELDCPVVFVQWYEAAMYCRWLSELEKLPESEMCFPPLEEIRKALKGEKPLVLPPDYLKRTGYRLPTEPEWEYACRAGSKTSKPHGVSNELLLHYAWDVRNALSRTWPVGQKKPNDFGLFDMHGNAAEWCLSLDGDYPVSSDGKPVEDAEGIKEINGESKCILRGAPFHPRPAPLRSAYRYWHKPTDHFSTIGFRIARTIR